MDDLDKTLLFTKKGLKDKARLCFAIKVATFSSVIQTRLRHFQNQKTCKLS